LVLAYSSPTADHGVWALLVCFLVGSLIVKRYFAAHTEIELASHIQVQLVPPVEMRTRDFEIYSVSIPSGIVGGDLIDAVETNGVVCTYGVAAGVLMSMVKAAVRMHLRTNAETGKGLLEAVNNTPAPMTEVSAYATFAYVLIKPGMPLTYSIAAHSPIFHLQRENGMVVRTPSTTCLSRCFWMFRTPHRRLMCNAGFAGHRDGWIDRDR
jgi:hypothetical protein